MNQIKSGDSEKLQIIVGDKLSKGNNKSRFQDIVGEIRYPDSNRAMDSTLLVSGFDSVYGSTELNINFPQTGAGFLAHTAISRGLYYLTQQYRDFRHNIMSYYSTTGFSQHASLDYFFKKNDHSHFTTGIDKIVVLNRLTASKDLTIKVYNVASQEEGQETEQIEFITTLQNVGKKYGFKVVSTTSPQAYFRDFKNPTFVIEDEYNGQEFDLERF